MKIVYQYDDIRDRLWNRSGGKFLGRFWGGFWRRFGGRFYDRFLGSSWDSFGQQDEATK